MASTVAAPIAQPRPGKTAGQAEAQTKEEKPAQDDVIAEMMEELEREMTAEAAEAARIHAEMTEELEREMAAEAAEAAPISAEMGTCPCQGLSEPPEPAEYEDPEGVDVESGCQEPRPTMKRLAVMPKRYDHENPINFFSLAHHVVLGTCFTVLPPSLGVP